MLTGSLEDLTLAVDAAATDALRAERRATVSGLSMGYRVGVDVGGTFTDLICVTADGEVVLDKTPTTLDDQSPRRDDRPRASSPTASASPSTQFCADLDIVVHGTTTADNTMIEMNGAPHRPARHRGPPRRDRDAPGPQGG